MTVSRALKLYGRALVRVSPWCLYMPGQAHRPPARPRAPRHTCAEREQPGQRTSICRCSTFRTAVSAKHVTPTCPCAQLTLPASRDWACPFDRAPRPAS
eukprot:scaffold12169_cov116-Isochrysis_galbana.AAC.3